MNAKANKKYFFEKIDRNYRLYLSLLMAFITWLLCKNQPFSVGFMFVWIAFSGSFSIFSWIIIFNVHPKGLQNIASAQDTSRTLVFLFILFAAFVSVFAVIALLQQAPNDSKNGLTYHIILAAAAVFCSWTLIHTLFTLHYAHLYYVYPDQNAHDNGKKSGGLEFPGTSVPDYFDFAYFSFVLGMTFQVSDVQITSPVMRRLALLHGFLAFIYSTIIISFSVSITSGIIGK